MFGRRFKKGFISNIQKWKKPFSKVTIKRKKTFFINFKYVNKLYSNLSFLRFKTRKFYLRKLNMNFLSLNVRDFGKCKNLKITPFKFLFKKYTIGFFICQSYGKLMDYHLNMILEKLRKFLGKIIYIQLNIKPYKLMFKRSAQVRMGGGKIAKFSKIYYPVFPGCVFLSLYGITYKIGLLCLKLLVSKLPIKFTLRFINFV